MLFLKRKTGGIMTRIGHVGEPVDHSECKQDGGVVSERSRRIALLDAGEGYPADRSSFCEKGDRYPAAPTGVANVVAELSQSTEDRHRRCRQCLSRLSSSVHYRWPYQTKRIVWETLEVKRVTVEKALYTFDRIEDGSAKSRSSG
jgi:hypothetical protein